MMPTEESVRSYWPEIAPPPARYPLDCVILVNWQKNSLKTDQQQRHHAWIIHDVTSFLAQTMKGLTMLANNVLVFS